MGDLATQSGSNGFNGELVKPSRHTMHELVSWVHSMLGTTQLENGNVGIGCDGPSPISDASSPPIVKLATEMDTSKTGESDGKEDAQHGEILIGIPCMVEIFQFLPSLLNVNENIGTGPKSNPIAYDEDVPLFALHCSNLENPTP